jgi:DNA modification methylase
MRVWVLPSLLAADPSRISGGGFFCCLAEVEMKNLPEQAKLKQAKLARTRRRRERLAQERRLAEAQNGTRRNDLLPELELRKYRIAELRAPKHRTRKADPEQIARHVRVIGEFGFSEPILVRDGQVYDGWNRVLAARELGLEEVPAIECSHLNEGEARALAVASKRIGELGEWDLDELRLEFIELVEFEIDLDVTAFTVEEQDMILLDPLDGSEEDPADSVEDPPKVPVTQLSDLWLLDMHKVACGDAQNEATFKPLLGEERVHAVLQDPPYNVKIAGNVSGLGKKVHAEFAMASGELSDKEFEGFLADNLKIITSYLVSGAVVFSFMDHRSIHLLYAAGESAGLSRINLVVWYKQSGAMGSLYRSAHELIAVFCNGKTPRVNNVELGKHGRNRCNVWEAPGANRRGSSANEMLDFHATPKPVRLCEDAIIDVTGRGEIVLDCFLGSGATLIACERVGRQCRGIELEPGFVDLAIRRWEKLTGQEAVLESTSETFTEVAARRGAVIDEKTGASDEGEE